MILEALHPAAMVLVPPKARKARHVHVAARTAVEVAELPADAAAPWDAAGSGLDSWPGLMRVEGRPGQWSTATWIGGGALTRDDLRAVLETDGAEGFDLRGTPLCAWGNPADRKGVQPRSPSTRGEAIDPAAARAVHDDGRARAAEMVRRHVADTYLVAGDRVLVRALPHALGYAHDRFDLRVGAGNEAVRLWSPTHFAAGPDDLDAMLGALSATLSSGHAESWRRLGEGLDPGIGARIALDSQPAIVRRLLAQAADAQGRAGADASRIEAIRAEGDALVPLEIAGMTGTCGLEDPGEALRILARAAAFASEAFPWSCPEVAQAWTISRVTGKVLLPRVPAPAHLDADAEALSELGPR